MHDDAVRTLLLASARWLVFGVVVVAGGRSFSDECSDPIVGWLLLLMLVVWLAAMVVVGDRMKVVLQRLGGWVGGSFGWLDVSIFSQACTMEHCAECLKVSTLDYTYLTHNLHEFRRQYILLPNLRSTLLCQATRG